MMKFHLISLLLLVSLSSYSQSFNISGKVTDEKGNALEGANLVLLNISYATVADKSGSFQFNNVQASTHELRITYVGYKERVMNIEVDQNLKLDITMELQPVFTDEVVVSATRAGETTPTSFTVVEREEIEGMNMGKDLPFILEHTPSAVVTSDAGNGVGYTGIRIRGSDPSRINVTINGIPLNDAESQTVFWVDLPDFASSIENIQIQRGIGTSTNGAGSFGGSINIKTTTLNRKAYGEIDEAFGSFNTFKHSILFGTGLINDHFTLDGRISKVTSDGYIDRATSNLQSLFLSAGYYDDNTSIRGNILLGKEVTYQAWYGVSEEDLDQNRTSNFAGTDYFAREEPYDNEVDDYRQDHYQILFSQLIDNLINLNIGLHYTKGKGFFEQYKVDQAFSFYRLETPVIGSDTILFTDLIRQRWLDNDFYGSTFSLEIEKGLFEVTVGGAWNNYVGDHFGEIIWAEFASDSEKDERFYYNRGTKRDLNIYAKTIYSATDELDIFLDLQLRSIHYEVEGFDIGFRSLDTENDYLFFNPKAGLSYSFNSNNYIYASVAYAEREPVRNDIIDAPQGMVELEPEKMVNIEAGYKYRRSNWRIEPNFYLMLYNDQLVLTGELNDVGTPVRTNVDKSYRAGIELVAAWDISDRFGISGNITISKNKINVFREYINTYDDEYVAVDSLVIINEYENTDIAFSPEIIASAGIHVEAIPGLHFDLIGKYVGKQHLDNTSNENRSLNPYFISDLYIKYIIEGTFFKELALNLTFYNIGDALYESNGYTFTERYVYYDENQELQITEPVTYNYYYPQAGFHVLGGISLNF